MYSLHEHAHPTHSTFKLGYLLINGNEGADNAYVSPHLSVGSRKFDTNLHK